MALNQNQRGVVRGMVIAAALTVVAIFGAAAWHPAMLLPIDDGVARLTFALKWSLLPALYLIYSGITHA